MDVAAGWQLLGFNTDLLVGKEDELVGQRGSRHGHGVGALVFVLFTLAHIVVGIDFATAPGGICLAANCRWCGGGRHPKCTRSRVKGHRPTAGCTGDDIDVSSVELEGVSPLSSSRPVLSHQRVWLLVLP